MHSTSSAAARNGDRRETTPSLTRTLPSERRQTDGAAVAAATRELLIALGAALLWFTLGGLLAPGIALGLFGIVYGLVSLAIASRAHHPRLNP